MYNMTKAMVELLRRLRRPAPGNSGWAVDRQNFDWVVPYHEGAIRTGRRRASVEAEHQAHNDKLVERQKVLADAWEELKAEAPADGKACRPG